MLIQELFESVSLQSTIKNIVALTADVTHQTYDKIKQELEKYATNRGGLTKGWKIVEGRHQSQWYQTYYWNKMENDLRDLIKQGGKKLPIIQTLLKNYEANFKAVEASLPEGLIEAGRILNVPELTRVGRVWMDDRKQYQDFILRLKRGEDASTQSKPLLRQPQPQTTSRETVVAQQQQSEQLVNFILGQVPKDVAGDIRNAIARSPNKLQALQAELTKRGIDLS